MSDSERKIGPVEVRWGRDRYKYYVLSDFLYTEWSRGVDLSKHSWPLQELSPMFTESEGRSAGTHTMVRTAGILLASSVIVYFSDYNKSIPLLAPFLLGLGLWWLVQSARRIIPRKWTELRYSSGTDATSLVQPEEKTEEWIQFEKSLSDAIHETASKKT